MNIFVGDGEGQSGLTGLPGNEANAVLHTSFSSNRSSTDGASFEESSRSQPPARQVVDPRNLTHGHGQVRTVQSYRRLEYLPILTPSSFNNASRNSRNRPIGLTIQSGSVGVSNQSRQDARAPVDSRARQRAHQQVTSQQTDPQPRAQQQLVLQQPIQQPSAKQSTSKQQPAMQNPVEQSPVKLQRGKQLPADTSRPSLRKDKGSLSLEYSGEKPAPEKLVDYGLSKSFNSTSLIVPDRLIGGGIIRERPTISMESSEQGKAMDKGNGNEKSPESKMSMRHNAPGSFGSSAVDITDEESAFLEKAQQTMDKDEEQIKRDMAWNSTSIEPHPTAEDAAKARSGMSKEDLAEELKIDIEELEKNERKLDAAEKERSSISEKDLAASGLELSVKSLLDNTEPRRQIQVVAITNHAIKITPATKDFFEGLSNYPEIIMELAKYLRPKDLIMLYSISKPFNEIINSYLSHTMQSAAKLQAPESTNVFKFKFYGELCKFDPASRPHPKIPQEVRMVPSPRWLQMVVHRDKTIRDILALLARQGHRMPEDMSLSLKKMWLIMDVATTRQRVQLFHSQYFTDKDVFNMQMFFVKLDMRFNDPFDGPGSDKLRRLMLGQRGLTPLCNLLKRKIGRTEEDVAKMGIRYAYTVKAKHRGLPLFDIPPEEIGIGHLEGWGKGLVHLLRPDELVVREAVRRRLGLKDHIMGMMLWGYINPRTGENITVTDEEKYMSESESEGEEYEAWDDEWESESDEEDDTGEKSEETPKKTAEKE